MDFKKTLQKFNLPRIRQFLDAVYGNKSGNNLMIVWVFCLFLSFLFLLICTKSSPLYPINDSVDVNAYFTMGKGMMNGLVPYRDLFDQKGPLLYFIFGIGYLISATSFLGVFFIEVLSFSFFLLFNYRSLSLLINPRISIISMPLLAGLILNLKSVTHGANAEEFCLPLLAASLFYLISFIKDDGARLFPYKTITLNGVFAGCILWIKFSLLGFWIGWILTLVIILVSKRQLRQAFYATLFFVIGILLTSIPWVIYFGVNKSIYDWLYTYFTINFTSYAENYPFLYRFYLTLAGITSQIRSNPFTGGILWLGIISFIVFPKFVKTKLHRIGLFLCVFLLVFGVFSGGRGYIYTTLITSPFIIFGVQVIFDLINGIFKKEMVVLSPFLLTLSIAIICLVATILVNQNTYFMKIKKSGLVQYKFASIINQSENPSLLNYGSLDLGFYFASGIIPNQKYFINLNFDYSRYPSILDEQNRYIKDKLIDYVVIALPDEESVKDLNTLTPVLVNNYHMIRKENQAYDNYEYIYLLFKKNP